MVARSLKHNLPAQPTPLIGRQQEIAGGLALLRRADVRLVTLTGAGGAGKTRLGLELATELLGDFPDGVFFVNLAPVQNPGLVASTIAQSVGVKEAGGQPLIEELRQALRNRQLLLLLDNFEHLMPAATVVADLLSAGPGVKVLATSREALRLRGEHELLAPPLATPDLARLPPTAQLIEYPAVQLFVQRAQAVRADFVLTHENAPLVAEICARLDALPLALELAAPWIKLLPPQALLARLGRARPALQLLSAGARDLPARHQTLRESIGWSYDLLAPDEQALFRRLTVFVGGPALTAVASVCFAAGDIALGPLEGLATLVDKNLLRQENEVEGEPRFVMLQTIREYGLEQLQASGEFETMRRAHAYYYLTLAEEREAVLTDAQQVRWLERLEQEHDDLRAALDWAAAAGQAEFGLRLASALWKFWYVRSYLSEGRERLAAALARPGADAGTPERALALHGAGILAWSQGDYGSARVLFQESLAIRRERGSKRDIAISLNSLAIVSHDQGDHAWARALFEESLAIKRELGDKQGIAATLNNLGDMAWHQGDYARARDLQEEGLAITREQGNKWGIAFSLVNLGNVAVAQRNYDAAQSAFEESLALRRELGDRIGQGVCLEGFASLAAAEGHPARAARLWGTAEALREVLGAPLTPDERLMHESQVAEARNQLGAKPFAAAWSEGKTVSLDQAIVYATESAPGHAQPGRHSLEPSRPGHASRLTSREIEVLRLVARGLTDAQVAETLVISPRTVNAHLTSIYSKLAVNSRTAAVRLAAERGLL